MNNNLKVDKLFIPQMFDGIDEELIAASETFTAKILNFKKAKTIIIAAVITILSAMAVLGGILMIFNPSSLIIPPVTATPTPTDTTQYNPSDFDIQNGVLISYNGNDTEITIPVGVVRVASQAFAQAKSVKVISIPKTLEEFEEGALTSCPNLETVNTGDNKKITSKNGFVLINNGSEILHVNKEAYQTIVTIPNGVVKIPDNFMNYNSTIEKLFLPDSVKNIGVNAFYECENLKEADLGEVCFIMKGAFHGSGLEKVDLGSSLIIIEAQAFMFTKLTSVTIPATIEIIGASAFYNTNVDTIIYQGSKEQFEDIKSYFKAAFKYFDDMSLLFYVDDDSPEALQFISNGDGTCTVTPSPSKQNSGDIVIYKKSPSGDTVTAIADFNNCKKITSITLPDTVKSLPNSAFEGCILLEKVIISDDIKVIPEKAFSNCPALTEFKFPDNLERIEERAFYQNPNFTELVFPKNVNYIGDSAFCYNVKVQKVDLSKTSMERIERGAFAGCHALTELVLPQTLKELDELVFTACITLKEVNLPKGIVSIGNKCFNTTAIESIIIPDSATLGEGCFSSCESLKSITLPKNLKEIPPSLFADCVSLEEITLPKTVEVLGASAFERAAIKKIVIPEKVTVISDKAFGYCHGLTSVEFEGNITEIGKEAFAGTGISSINMPDSLKTIKSSAFVNCSKLTDIVFSKNLEKLEDRVFHACTSIKTVTLPESLVSIGERCFEFCSSLKEIYLHDSVTNLGRYAFGNCSSLSKVRLSKNLTSIQEYTFTHTSALGEIVFPDSLEKIGGGAFYYSAIKEVIIPQKVSYVGNNAFSNCAALQKVRVEGKTELGTNTFASCVKLKTVIFAQAPTFGRVNGSFIGCSLLETVEIKNGSMDLSATTQTFENCSSLKNIDFSKISALGYGCFKNCTSLPQSIVLSPSVTSISRQAFMGCTSIKSIVLSDSTTEIEAAAFSGCTKLEEISFSDKLEILGTGSFEDTSIKTVNYKGSKENWNSLDTGLSRLNKASCNVNYIN